jgi:cardiolipin synthase
MPAWVIPWVSWHTVAVVAGLLLYVVATQGLQQRRPPTAAIAWVILIALLPYVGVPLFLLFGSRKRGRAGAPATHRDRPQPVLSPGADPLAALAQALNLPPAAAHGTVRLHTDGATARQALLEVVAAARVQLHICTYLIGNDALGAALLECVRARVGAGVTVRILVDGVGGLRSWPMVRRLRACGAQVAWFVPPLHRPLHGRTNLRNHRKLVIADGSRVWLGGRNLAAEYFEGTAAIAAWADLSLDTAGPLAAQLNGIFLSDWAFATGQTIAPVPLTPTQLPTPAFSAGSAQPVPSGPDYADDTLQAVLLLACYRAQDSIAIATPYFVPDESLLQALCLAARRGVCVRLLLPARSNHRLADLARGRALQQAAAAGVQIQLYPTMLHAKLVIIDEAWLLLGSANFDSRSLFLNYELMVALRDHATLAQTLAWFDASILSAQPWKAPAPGMLRNFGDGLLLWLAFQI